MQRAMQRKEKLAKKAELVALAKFKAECKELGKNKKQEQEARQNRAQKSGQDREAGAHCHAATEDIVQAARDGQAVAGAGHEESGEAAEEGEDA